MDRQRRKTFSKDTMTFFSIENLEETLKDGHHNIL